MRALGWQPVWARRPTAATARRAIRDIDYSYIEEARAAGAAPERLHSGRDKCGKALNEIRTSDDLSASQGA